MLRNRYGFRSWTSGVRFKMPEMNVLRTHKPILISLNQKGTPYCEYNNKMYIGHSILFHFRLRANKHILSYFVTCGRWLRYKRKPERQARILLKFFGLISRLGVRRLYVRNEMSSDELDVFSYYVGSCCSYWILTNCWSFHFLGSIKEHQNQKGLKSTCPHDWFVEN